jgi:O-antigen/teichoic acid export membrane protein
MIDKKKITTFFLFFFMFVLSYAFSSLIQIFLSRNLNPSKYGEISSIFSLLFIISFICSGFGLNLFLQNILSKTASHQKIIFTSLKYITIFQIVGFVIFLICLNQINENIFTLQYLLIFFFYLLGFAFFELLITIHQIRNQFVTYSFLNLILTTIRLIGIIFILDYNLTEKNIYLIYGISGLIFFLLSFYQVYKYAASDDQIEPNEPKISINFLFKGSFYYGVSSLCYLFILNGIVILLKLFFGNETSGYFQAAYNIFLIITLPFAIIIQKFFLPKMHYWFYNNKSKLKKFLIQGMFFSFFISSFVALLINQYSIDLINFIYGDQYNGSLIFLKFLLFLIPLRVITILCGSFLNTGDNYKKKTIYYLETLIIFILSFVLLSLYYSINGAIMSLILSELYLLSRYFLHLQNNYFKNEIK